MDPIYLAFTFRVTPKEPVTEILIAELAQAGFESFVEGEDALVAYVQKHVWQPALMDGIYVLHSGAFSIDYSFEEIEHVNWNAEWEKNFKPIQVGGKVSVRASFHENPNMAYDLVINPKMSFGTGHHETTHMMIEHLLELDLTGLTVLDMGCGTGILAIFSEMKGAGPIDAIDIDLWCYENALENTALNRCEQITVHKGDVRLLAENSYDLIIANINRNTLLEDLPAYVASLNPNGLLLLSGFYEKDISLLDSKASGLGLQLLGVKKRKDWRSLKYFKNA